MRLLSINLLIVRAFASSETWLIASSIFHFVRHNFAPHTSRPNNSILRAIRTTPNVGWILSTHRTRTHHTLSVAIRQNFSFKLFSIAPIYEFLLCTNDDVRVFVCVFGCCRLLSSTTRADKNQPTSQIVYIPFVMKCVCTPSDSECECESNVCAVRACVRVCCDVCARVRQNRKIISFRMFLAHRQTWYICSRT